MVRPLIAILGRHQTGPAAPGPIQAPHAMHRCHGSHFAAAAFAPPPPSHQGAYTPGMVQWQGFLKLQGTARTASVGGGYSHFAGLFYGLGRARVVPGPTQAACAAACDNDGANCSGFTYAAPVASPSTPVQQCYLVPPGASPNHMDMSNVGGGCQGDSAPSTCPFNLYRVSGDISASWQAMLANLEYLLPFLGQGGVHPPYPQGPQVRSVPGGWGVCASHSSPLHSSYCIPSACASPLAVRLRAAAWLHAPPHPAYPDMLEVGNLANSTEDRSHFSAWAVTSSPLILSYDLTDPARMARAWPIISNHRVIAGTVTAQSQCYLPKTPLPDAAPRPYCLPPCMRPCMHLWHR